MGNALLYRCELDPVLRELAIIRVGRLSRAAYESSSTSASAARPASRGQDRGAARRHRRGAGFQRQREGRAALHRRRGAHVRASDKTLKAVEAFLSRGALIELTLTIGYYIWSAACSRPPASTARTANRVLKRRSVSSPPRREGWEGDLPPQPSPYGGGSERRRDDAYRVLVAQFMHETNTFSKRRPRSRITASAG